MQPCFKSTGGEGLKGQVLGGTEQPYYAGEIGVPSWGF